MGKLAAVFASCQSSGRRYCADDFMPQLTLPPAQSPETIEAMVRIWVGSIPDARAGAGLLNGDRR